MISESPNWLIKTGEWVGNKHLRVAVFTSLMDGLDENRDGVRMERYFRLVEKQDRLLIRLAE